MKAAEKEAGFLALTYTRWELFSRGIEGGATDGKEQRTKGVFKRRGQKEKSNRRRNQGGTVNKGKSAADGEIVRTVGAWKEGNFEADEHKERSEQVSKATASEWAKEKNRRTAASNESGRDKARGYLEKLERRRVRLPIPKADG